MGKFARLSTAVGAVLLAATLAAAAPKAGDPAGAFSLPAFGQADKKVDNAAIKGKDTVLVFFNTACGMCREEVKDVLPVRDEMKFNLVFVNVDIAWEQRLPVYIEQMGLQKETIIVDSDFSVSKKLGVKSTPAMVLIDKEGKFKGVKGGYDGKEGMKEFIKF